MKPEDSRRVADLFESLVDLPPAERDRALERGTADCVVRREAEALLAADAEVEAGAGSPLLQSAALPPLAQTAVPDPPEHIGPYRLVCRLGEGGMSEVFLGVRDDGELEGCAAIKLIRRELLTPEMVRRFETERQILASLHHPSIARVFDAGKTADGVPYFIMEHIEGEPIDQYCDRHRLSIAERLRIFRQVCEALHFAHQNLVVHRDIKPSNILVPETGQPKLLDFGIAKLLNPELVARGSEPTVGPARLLTPEYASPEQVLGKPVTAASDVYALGVLLFRLLTGGDPYRLRERPGAEVEQLILSAEPDTPSAYVRRLLKAPRADPAQPPAAEPAKLRGTQPRAWLRALAGDLDAILAKALRKEPQNRYSSAAELAEAIHRHLASLPQSTLGRSPLSLAGRFHPPRLAVVVNSAVLLVAVAGLLVQTARLADSRAAERREQERARALASSFERLLAEAASSGETIERAAGLIREGLAGQPETQSELLAAVGQAYMSLGWLDEAAATLQQALEIRRRLGGGEDEGGVAILTVLAAVEAEQGDFVAAEALHRRALAIRVDTHPASSLVVAESQIGLGRVSLAHGHAAAAEQLFQQALLARENRLGQGDVRVAETLADLGHAVGRLGSPSAAESLFRRASKIVRRSAGSQSREFAISLIHLAAALLALDRTEEASSLLREAAEIERLRCAVSSPGPAAPLVALALSAARSGRQERAPGDHVSPGCAAPALPVPHAVLLMQEVAQGLSALGHPAESDELWKRAGRYPPRLTRAAPLLTDSVARDPASGACVPDGGFAETSSEPCCSGVIAGGTTVCGNPADWGGSWRSCRHVCGSRLAGGCVPPGGVTDTLELTDCCSGNAVAGSVRCLNPADVGTSSRTCVLTCA
jgi:serine/threonine-protein kinase